MRSTEGGGGVLPAQHLAGGRGFHRLLYSRCSCLSFFCCHFADTLSISRVKSEIYRGMQLICEELGLFCSSGILANVGLLWEGGQQCFKFHVLSCSYSTMPTVSEIIMCYVICVLLS